MSTRQYLFIKFDANINIFCFSWVGNKNNVFVTIITVGKVSVS